MNACSRFLCPIAFVIAITIVHLMCPSYGPHTDTWNCDINIIGHAKNVCKLFRVFSLSSSLWAPSSVDGRFDWLHNTTHKWSYIESGNSSNDTTSFIYISQSDIDNKMPMRAKRKSKKKLVNLIGDWKRNEMKRNMVWIDSIGALLGLVEMRSSQ